MAASPAQPDPATLQPADLVRAEAAALEQLALRLEGPMREPFAAVVALLAEAAATGHRAIVTGVGKSGIIARKLAATLRSTGTPAHFLHPAEALHGDLGMILTGDPVLMLSASGETAELLALLPLLARTNTPVVALCGCTTSTLAREAEHLLDTTISAEACPHNLAPTASTTVLLALSDALALSVSQGRGFAPEDFADLHPGGRLGRRLARVRDLMHTGDAMPAVSPDCTLPELIHEMSRKKLGITLVVEPASPNQSLDQAPAEYPSEPRLLGIISDGDLRRLLERDGADALARRAGEILQPHPATISPDRFATEALALLEERKITSLVAVSDTGSPVGVLHLHDLWTRRVP